MTQNDSKRIKIIESRRKGPKGLKKTQNDSKWPQITQSDSKMT